MRPEYGTGCSFIQISASECRLCSKAHSGGVIQAFPIELNLKSIQNFLSVLYFLCCSFKKAIAYFLFLLECKIQENRDHCLSYS